MSVMINKLEQLVTRYRELGIDTQIDYEKFANGEAEYKIK